MVLLSEKQLESGAARLAKSLTLPGTRLSAERRVVYDRISAFLQVLNETGHECTPSTMEDMLWAAASMDEWQHAMYWALSLASTGRPVVQWQQLPDLISQSLAASIGVEDARAPGSNSNAELPSEWQGLTATELAVEVATAICPLARQQLVLEQIKSRVSKMGASSSFGRSATENLLAFDMSESDSDQDIEDMVFSDDSDAER
jgi:hypothetical protein